MRLENKIAIITGASSGLGAATARLFAGEGAVVIVADILDDTGNALVDEINERGGKASYVHLDVSNEPEWNELVSNVIDTHGKLDILVNNAGVSASIPDLLDLDTWHRQMDINLTGTFLGIRAAVPAMQSSGGGSIINMSSVAGMVGMKFSHMGYNAAKGGIRTMTKAAAVQFAKDNIRVNSVHPGMMPAMRTATQTADPEMRESMLSMMPMGRVGRVEEVAYANLFLASDEASYITGVELPVDGGFLAT